MMSTLLIAVIVIAIVVIAVRGIIDEQRRIPPASQSVAAEHSPLTYDRRDFQLGCLWSFVVALVGGQLLMGIPGVFLLDLLGKLARVFGPDPMERMGEGGWGAGILISWLWPVPLAFASRWFTSRFPNKLPIERKLFALAVAVAFGTLLSLTVIVGAILFGA